MTDDSELRNFLQALDDSTRVEVSDWEAQFISSNLTRDRFSYKQREIIMHLIEKYGQKIGWH